MLDTTNVRNEIAEARRTRDAIEAQRAALDGTLAKLDAFIDAGEALLLVLPATQTTFVLGEVTRTPAPTLRQLVAKVMQTHIGTSIHEAMIYEMAVDLGAEERESLDAGAEAVKYALYDLKKKDPGYVHLGGGEWVYTPI